MSWDVYINEVLGIQSFLRPRSDQGASAKLSAIRILFLSQPTESPLIENDLFRRMLAAMKLEPQEYDVWDLEAVDLATREQDIRNEAVVVSFSQKLSDHLSIQRPHLALITTPHPEAVAQDPSLKRQVWNDLKRALEKSDLASRLPS